jgi:uncharacterized membrane protein (UPF0136 family)
MNRALKKNGYFLLIYAILVFSGGLMGFVLKKSTPSLLAGGIFGLGLLFSSVLHFVFRKGGVILAFILLFLLELFFSYRFIRTGAFFPSGLMLALNSGIMILLIMTSVKGARSHEETIP